MQNISVDRTQVNVELLDAELKNALGVLVKGISTGRGQVIVHIDDDATDADIDHVEQIVIDHDETGLTADQQKQQQRATDIAAGRQIYDVPLDEKSITLEGLALRIKWLEEELRDLRGL